MRFDLHSLRQPLEALIVLFYVAMALALLATLMGSPGWGFLFLLLGSAALVARTAMETLQRQPRRGRPAGPPQSANR